MISSGVEQLAARQAHNLKVVGSSPTPASYSNDTGTVWYARDTGQGGSTPTPYHLFLT
jgi:hypothetical protein